MGDRTLDYIALCVLIFVLLTLIYGVIYIHDIPYEIAKKRKHPHRDAIHTAGWVSLFLMHTIWPFLWIWATLYKPEDDSWGFGGSGKRAAQDDQVQGEVVASLQEKIEKLEKGRLDMEEEFAGKVDQLQARISELEVRIAGTGEAD